MSKCQGPTTIPNHVDGSRNQVEVTSKFWNQESNFRYYSCKFQCTPIKYYHMICKPLFGKQESEGNCQKGSHKTWTGFCTGMESEIFTYAYQLFCFNVVKAPRSAGRWSQMSLFFHHPPAITIILSFTHIQHCHINWPWNTFRRFQVQDIKVSLAMGLECGFKLKAVT